MGLSNTKSKGDTLMRKTLLMILMISSIAAAKLKDMYVVMWGNTPLQVQNYINALPCKWKAIGELVKDGDMYRQVVICHNVSEQRRGYFKSLMNNTQSK
jgi:hypothetical protein